MLEPPFADIEAIALTVKRPTWQTVARITPGTPLPKRRTGASKDALVAARSIATRFGCYSWATATEILYCGSYSQDYKASAFGSNLEGRLYQYLCNHKRDSAGHPKNTNALIYDRLVQKLSSTAALFQVLSFDRILLDDRAVDFTAYSCDRYLVRAVERLLICFYKRHGQCAWNDR